jgi:hypothetical protein
MSHPSWPQSIAATWACRRGPWSRPLVGLSAHRFSQAWGCARKVTDGRITGLAASRVDGTPALLVYTKSEGSTLVTVVTGCASDAPSAGPSAVLPR